MNRPDTCFYVISKFISDLLALKDDYFRLAEEANLQAKDTHDHMKFSCRKLIEYVSIMKTEHFRSMVEYSDSNWREPSGSSKARSLKVTSK
jgi:hypothetical protein